jgi:uncharacterized protein YggE
MRTIIFLALIASLTLQAQHSDNNRDFKGNSYSNWQSSTNVINGGFHIQQNLGQLQLKPNELAIKANVLVNVKATDFLLVFNLIQSGETAALTNEMIDKRLSGFKEDLKNLGINEDQMFTDMIYMIPIFEKDLSKKLFGKNRIEIPKSFEIQKNIHIKFNDLKMVDKMVALAGQNEIYDIAKLDYFMNDHIAAIDTVQSLAVKQIQRRIDLYKNLNLDLSKLQPRIKDDLKTIYPTSQYTGYDSYVSTSHYHKESNSLDVRRPKAISYDQVPYQEYEVIIDPVLLEPVIQISYTMLAIYNIPEEKDPEIKAPKDRLFYLTPDGELKPMQLNL